ncbi:MAG TPA: PAS domain S-box protein [Candidatus Acidoferrales bacterium]
MSASAVPGSQSFKHSVQFYSNDALFADDLCTFLGSVLSTGSSAIVIGTKGHNDAILRKLQTAEVNLTEAIIQGRYQPLDASEVLSRFFMDGELDKALFDKTMDAVISRASAASRDSNKKVIAFGEMVALLWAEGKTEEAIELEKLWNQLSKRHSFELRCAYPIQGFCWEKDEDAFSRVCAEHTVVVPEESHMEPGPKEARAGDAVALEQDLQATKEWNKRERRFRLLVESIQDYAIFMLDPDGRITSWNTGAERIKGYKPEEIIGEYFSKFYLPEDLASGKPQTLLGIAGREGRAEDEGWRVRKNGEKFWARVTITAVRDENGELIGFGKVTRDLTERKIAEETLHRQEERLRLFVTAVQDYALFMLGASGHVATWNTGAERIKGYKASEIIGQHFSVFYPEEDLRAGKPQRELEIATKEGRFEDYGWRVRKDGSKFWANVVITAVRDSRGKLIGFGNVTRDLTERMLTQKSLEESSHRLEESEKSLRNLSLHLLRTQDEERRRIGREIHDSLGQYLSVLKMKLDSMSPDVKEAASCADLVEECVKEVRTISYLLYPPMLEEMGLKTAIPWYLDGFSKRSGIEATFSCPEDFARLPRDAELVLFRVLQESLTNVQRHSGSKTVAIRVGRSGDSVILEVIDQGKGLPPAVLEQAHQDWMGSLGVGLRGMSERVRQLGGSLEMSSHENGTQVRATVPAHTSSQP